MMRCSYFCANTNVSSCFAAIKIIHWHFSKWCRRMFPRTPVLSASCFQDMRSNPVIRGPGPIWRVNLRCFGLALTGVRSKVRAKIVVRFLARVFTAYWPIRNEDFTLLLENIWKSLLWAKQVERAVFWNRYRLSASETHKHTHTHTHIVVKKRLIDANTKYPKLHTK